MQGDALVGPTSGPVLEEDVVDDLALFDTKPELFITLNSTAGDVWRLATGEFTLRQLVERLAESYQVAPSDISDDVTAMVEEFIDAGLIETRDRL